MDVVTRLYESELHTINEMLTVVGIPGKREDGDTLPTHKRVRVLIERWLELRERLEVSR